MKNKKNIVIVVIVSLALLGLGVWYFGGEKLKRVQRLQDAMSSGFEYYGKVVDQHGDSVVGANVLVDIGYYPFIPNGNFYPSHKTQQYTTDAEGRFSIVGEKGESISIDLVEKSGYEIHYWFPPLTSMTFSRVGMKGLKKISDPNKPVIFHAWKKTEAEPLFFDEAQINFDPSGTIYAIDLYHWSKVTNGNIGDIRVSCKRPLNLKREYPPFDWQFIITAINVGIVESNDIFMNEAPESGYQSEWKLTMDKESKHWSSRALKKFYIQSRNGELYGRLELEIVPIYNENCRVAGKWWLNPNGSRNLQYDPSKRIYPK